MEFFSASLLSVPMGQFVDFLRLQKIKNEVKTSIEELDRDEFLGLDEAFEIATTKYAQH